MCFLGWKPLKAIVVNVCTLCARASFYLGFLWAKNQQGEEEGFEYVCVCVLSTRNPSS